MRQFANLGGILTNKTKELVEKNVVQISTLVNNVYNTELNINKTLQVSRAKTKFFFFFLRIYNLKQEINSNSSTFFLEHKRDKNISRGKTSL